MHNTQLARSASAAATADVDIASYLRVLAPRKGLLALGAIVGGLALVSASLLLPREYEAEASLALSRPKLEGGTDTTSVGNFVPFLSNRAVATQVIHEFHLDASPYRASPTTFFGTAVNVDEVRNSTVLTVTGRLRDRELVAKVVNRVAEIGVAAAQRASQQEALQIRDYIGAELEVARKRFEGANEALRNYRESAQLEMVQRDVDAALNKRSDLLTLSMAIETAKARLAKSQDELAARSRTDTISRSIESDSTLKDAARLTGTSNVLPLSVKSEEPNKVYESLDQEIASTKTDLAAMQRERAQMSAKQLDGNQLKQLNQLYAREAELDRLQTDRDLAEKVYTQIATSYETARLTLAGRTSALQILASAVPPDQPESRHTVAMALTGVVLGLLMAAITLIATRGGSLERISNS